MYRVKNNNRMNNTLDTYTIQPIFYTVVSPDKYNREMRDSARINNSVREIAIQPVHTSGYKV